MKKVVFIIAFMTSTTLLAQEKDNRAAIFVSTSHGISIVKKEAWSNTQDKTYPLTSGFAYTFSSGISIQSKSGNRFSDIRLTYRSYGNGMQNIVSPQSMNDESSKTSRDRFNYLGIGYQYAHYLFKIKNFNTFLSAGLELSYILNRKMKLKYANDELTITEKGKNISENVVLITPPTFYLEYGLDLEKGIYGLGQTSRVSLNITLDQAIFKKSSPSNQYIGALLKYQIIL